MRLVPYIHFNGEAEEALNFYANALGGEILHIQRYGDSPMPTNEAHKNKIMHARLAFDGNLLMMSDVFEGTQINKGENIQLSIDVEDAGKLDTIFANMAEGGTITMPVDNTFWGARFGMLKDKFGVLWMFNHELQKQ